MEIDEDKLKDNFKKLWEMIEGDLSPETLWKVAKEFNPGFINAFALDTIYKRQLEEPKTEPDDKK